MDVVATAKGFYGGQLRERGDLFTLKNGKTDFSTRWMAKAGTAEAKQLLRENAADSKGLSAAQIAMEEAEATGRAGAHKAEMAELKAQLAELKAMLAGGGKDVDTEGEDETEVEPDGGDEPEDGAGEGDAPEGGAPDETKEAPTERKTRRTRR